MSLLLALGRMLFVILFIVSGLSKLFDIATTASSISAHVLTPYASYLAPVTPYLTQIESFTGLPTPQLLAILAGVVEVIGGLLIAFDLGSRWVALVLIVYIAVATATYHDFWNMTGGDRLNNMIHAMKNLSIIGALVMIFAGGLRLLPPALRHDDV
ncbi:MAG: DoxX family protein [Xanthobacteraceae bacterium]|nr:MAG: DoxX family protein [Xanthobacteraceae bacterium]